MAPNSADIIDHRSPTTLVLLGASNLTLAWPRIMRQIETRFAPPREIFTAHGMGRSYLSERSGFAIRQLPGILNSALWQALDKAKPSAQPPAVLITDIGNDLLFGSTPETIADSVDACLQRIRNWHDQSRIVLTRPPVDSVATIGPLRYAVFRKILFPRCRLSVADVRSATIELDQHIESLAVRHSLPVLKPAPLWYGSDPIHIRRRHQSAAFGAMMDLWNLTSSDAVPSSGTRHPRPTAQTRWILGRERHQAQPVVALNGTNVFAY